MKKELEKSLFEEMGLTEKGRMGRRCGDAVQEKEHTLLVLSAQEWV